MKKKTYIIVAVVLVVLIGALLLFPFSQKGKIVGKTYYCFTDRITYFTINDDNTITFCQEFASGPYGFKKGETGKMFYKVRGKKLMLENESGIVDISGEIQEKGRVLYLDFLDGHYFYHIDGEDGRREEDMHISFVESLIREIPYNPSENKQAVEDAQYAYDSLTEEEKAEVFNVDDLKKAQSHIKDVQQMIDIYNSKF